ncbi:HAMP domain-containing sensor histidine kinase [Leptospira sp. GIMC2001]|uniref:HAMP domain-containing sensor histidine kinase n=1 Tax=Leptospira sp. GIMC2001 TaxID=1513297 RepID=UPI002349A76B|nr:HAMP domain-containing sensor histidine kinase [Leptospira sp. GIMC2001]WCL48961.1 ATP-binding protein [Leptospira sp. GIMC2001]
MRSFFSTLLLSNWAYLLSLFITALGVLYLDSILNPELRILLFSVFFMGAMFGSFYISYSIAKIVIAPLAKVEKKTDEINAGDFGTELTRPDIRELAKLTESINGMARRLKNQFVDLTLEKEKFNSLLQNLKEGVFAVDITNKVLFQNKNIPDLFIAPNSQSQLIQDCILNPTLLQLIDDSIRDQEEKRETIVSNHHYYNIRIYPLRSNNSIFIYMGVILDVTEEKQNQIIREQFFQNASHELKTPITSIKGFTETLENTLKLASDSQEKKFLDAILRNTDRMIRIIEDMMEISKLESLSTKLMLEKFDLNELVQNIKLSLSSIFDKKNQILKISIPSPFMINADLVLMEHLIINLVSNASAYSNENSEIVVLALRKGESTVLEVIDNGIGIGSEDADRIFERFYRVDSNRSRKGGGTGLGLSIVKHISRLHGGDVVAVSNPEGGSIFRVSIPD